MKKLILALLALIFLPQLAQAATCSTYPYTLTNGQTADANQVMANFTSILNCVNSSVATSGANSNITSLSGLTTPLSIPQGGTGQTTAAAAITALGGLVASNNLSDLTSASTAITNLGGFGTTAGTFAQGNDGRFLGPTVNLFTGNHTLGASDVGNTVRMNCSGTATLTLPTSGSLGAHDGSKVDIIAGYGCTVTLAQSGSSIDWAPSGAGGNRTMTGLAEATVTGLDGSVWLLVGVGIT